MPEDLKYIINQSQLTDIGAAIRSKLGEQDTYTVDEMPSKIDEISGSSGLTVPYLTMNITNISEEVVAWEDCGLPESYIYIYRK